MRRPPAPGGKQLADVRADRRAEWLPHVGLEYRTSGSPFASPTSNCPTAATWRGTTIAALLYPLTRQEPGN
jgi:hypothetical protein